MEILQMFFIKNVIIKVLYYILLLLKKMQFLEFMFLNQFLQTEILTLIQLKWLFVLPKNLQLKVRMIMLLIIAILTKEQLFIVWKLMLLFFLAVVMIFKVAIILNYLAILLEILLIKLRNF